MKYKSLLKLFYADRKNYEKIYNERFNSPNAVHLNFEISGSPAFFLLGAPFVHKITDIYKTDKKIGNLCRELSYSPIKLFAKKCLVDEIVLSNDIEGVYSSRREINGVLAELKEKSRGRRYEGIVRKYLMLQKGEPLSFNSCKDIRELYNDLVYFEIAHDDPDNLPDGEIFRKGSTSVLSAAQKEIHTGVYPESKIKECMDKALKILNSTDIDLLFRTATFHYLFGYIHPFYDGNGRTSRFISSYLLSTEFEPLIGYRLSYTIKENIRDYYEAFKICNDKRNKGDLTPFVIMFTDIVCKSLHGLYDALNERYEKCLYYQKLTAKLPFGCDYKYSGMYLALIQAALFSENGISTQELMEMFGISRSTVTNRLKSLADFGLVVKKSVGITHCYKLNLDAAEDFSSGKNGI